MMDRKTKRLLKKLEHKDPKVRYDAVMALGKTGNTELMQPLDRVATLDENPKVRDLASKAVRTLNLLHQRELEKQRAALKAQMAQEKFDWPTLAQERLMQDRDFRDRDTEEWDYERRLQKIREEKESAEREARRAAQRKRRTFRIILYLAVVIGIMGLVVVLREVLDDTPKDTEEALIEIRDIVQKQQAALVKYCEVLSFDPAGNCQLPAGATTFDCNTLKSVEKPALPEWLNKDEPVLVDQAHIIDDMYVINDSISLIQQSIEKQCANRELVNVSEWPEYPGLGNLLVAGLREAAGVASHIETALNPLPATTPEVTG